MIEASTSVEIRRPAREVYAFVADVRNNPAWQRGQQSCEWTSDPPPRVGSTYEQHARFLGRDVRNAFTVVEHEPGRRIAFQSTGGSFPLTIMRTVEALGDGRARFTEAVRGDPRGFFRLAEPLLRPLVRRSIRRDFRVLKNTLERAPRPGG